MKKYLALLLTSALLTACGQKEGSAPPEKKDDKTEGHGIYKVPPATKRPAHEGF